MPVPEEKLRELDELLLEDEKEEKLLFPYKSVEARIEALNSRHKQKIRQLLHSIQTLKDSLQKERQANKDHRRSALIQDLRKQLAEQEFLVSVAKDLLVQKRGFDSLEQVNEELVRQSMGDSAGLQPESREQLQNRASKAERTIAKQKRDIERLKALLNGTPERESNLYGRSKDLEETKESEEDSQSQKETEEPNEGSRQEDAVRIIELMEQVKELQVQLDSKDILLRAQADDMESLHSELTLFASTKNKYAKLEKKYKGLTQVLEQLKAESITAARRYTQIVEEKLSLQAELQFLRESHVEHSDHRTDQRLEDLKTIKALQQETMTLIQSLNAQQQAFAEARGKLSAQLQAKDDELQQKLQEIKTLQKRVTSVEESANTGKTRKVETASKKAATPPNEDDSSLVAKLKVENASLKTKLAAANILTRESRKEVTKLKSIVQVAQVANKAPS